MIETASCNEFFLDDVVWIDIFRSSDVQFSAPVTVPGVTALAATYNAPPLLSIAYSIDGDDTMQEIDTAPALKVSSKLEAAGRIYTHDLQLSLNGDIYKVREMERQMGTDDVYVRYTFANGRKKMSVSLPNTSQLTIDEQAGSTHTVKLSLTSLNPLVIV